VVFKHSLEEIAAAARKLRDMADAFDRADQAMRQEVDGTDSRGAITVHMDSGGRVVNVRPSARWREFIDANEVGAAVLQAVQAAQARRLQLWAEALVAPGDEDGTPDDDDDETSASVVDVRHRPSSNLPDDKPLDLVALIGEGIQELDRVIHLETTDVRDPTTVTGPGSRVTVTLGPAAEVLAIDVDARWAATTNRESLAVHLVQAFESAYEQFDSERAPQHQTSSMPTELARVANDPVGTLRQYAESLKDWPGLARSTDRTPNVAVPRGVGQWHRTQTTSR
jgi:DNA-binding protein YbaB